MYSRGILFLFFILPGYMNAQPGFNRIYGIYGVDLFARLIVDADTIFCFGVAYDTANLPSPLQVQMVKMDSSGNVVKSRLYKDPHNDFLGMDFLFGEVIKTSKGYFAFPVVAFNRAGYLWIQVDRNLEVKAISEFQSPNDNTIFDEAIIEMPDTGFLIVGHTSQPNLKKDGFIRRVDKNGKLLWFKYYGDYGDDESFRDIVKVSDNKFVLCGSVGPSSNEPISARAGLWVIDSNGTVLQTWIGPESPDLTTIKGIIMTIDGGFVAHGRIYLGEGPWGSRVQACVMKFSADLKLEWLKPVGPTTTQYNDFLDMIQTPDGHYLVAGERTAYGDLTQPSSGDWGGWLFKFTEQGDSLWARADNAPPGYKSTGEFVYGGVGLLSSGNIVAGGKGDVNDNFVGWVVKVTADGCLDTLFCHTSSNHESLIGVSLSLYPNPARDWVTLEAPPEYDHCNLELYSLDGCLQLTQAGSINQQFDISGVPNGIYLCRFVSDNGKHFYSRLVVQK